MKLQQTPVIAGKPSTVTLVTADASGNPINETFDVPPGPTTTLPDNLATNDDLAQMVAGTFNLAPQDLRGVGLNWDGKTGTPRLAYGGIGGNEPALFSYLLGTDQKGNYRCTNGNTVLQLQGEDGPVALQRFYVTACNGMTVTFPKAFASNLNVRVVVCPHVVDTSHGAQVNICQIIGTPDRYGFKLSIYQLTGSDWNSGMVPVDIIATGTSAAAI